MSGQSALVYAGGGAFAKKKDTEPLLSRGDTPLSSQADGLRWREA